METILLEILNELKKGDRLGDEFLAKIIHKHNRNLVGNEQHYSKKRLLPYYLKVKESNPEVWASWSIDQEIEKQLFQLLQVKPRRSASGVATITVITKPWRCSSNCLYCPNDIRMPKSYLCDEPACQRAERNYFDPYLQVASRLRALTHMGHPTDKIELIILGGAWSDYPAEYQVWFVTELFRALNETENLEQNSRKRRNLYRAKGLSNRNDDLLDLVKELQEQVNRNSLTYNQAIYRLYGENDIWQNIAGEQISSFRELESEQKTNETARHRVVGLAIETRPDDIDCGSLTLLRRLGCTKVQIGVQSLDPTVLKLNDRNIGIERVRESFALLRVFGFKIHAHFMLNLFGSSREEDKRDYQRFVSEEAYLPDEVKLYPCVLVKSARLRAFYEAGSWQPYSENELVDILVANTLFTPPFMRISRMVRDISACDILAGSKKANLRQIVEKRIEETGENVSEIRYREIGTEEIDIEDLTLDTLHYETTVTDEYFLQWITTENKIAGFLRLSLPKSTYLLANQLILPVKPKEAMIREVHIYGKVARLHDSAPGAQHLGLGRQLIESACEIARLNDYTKINVISSVGTREYYRSLGFSDSGLYQQKSLIDTA